MTALLMYWPLALLALLALVAILWFIREVYIAPTYDEADAPRDVIDWDWPR